MWPSAAATPQASAGYSAAMKVIFERMATVGACRPRGTGDQGAQPKTRDAARLMNDPESMTVHDSGAAGDLDEDLVRGLRMNTNMAAASAVRKRAHETQLEAGMRSAARGYATLRFRLNSAKSDVGGSAA